MTAGARRLQDAALAMAVSPHSGPLAAFEAVLRMIPQPTLVTDSAGRILHANALGQRVVTRDRIGVERALAQAARGEPQDLAWRLTPIGGARRRWGYIAVLEHSDAPGAGASPEAAALRWNLTARQAEVLGLVAGGATNAEIAETLGIKQRTVEFHLSAIFDKAGVDNRATLIARLSTF